jgi:hypothetical protein
MSYVLVMFIYAGAFSKGDSVALNSVDGFSTLESCQKAGQEGNPLVGGTVKEYKFVCIQKK